MLKVSDTSSQKNFEWKDAGVDVDGKDDLIELATQMLSWKAFSNNSSYLNHYSHIQLIA